MSTDDVVSEARALLERFRTQGRASLRGYDASQYLMRRPSDLVRAELTVGELRALLDALDRLDALAPLAEAAARVREAGTEHERVKALGYRSSEVKRATEWAKTEERLANAALLALALARGER